MEEDVCEGERAPMLAFLHDTSSRYTAKYSAQGVNPGDVPPGKNVIGLNCWNRKIQRGLSFPNIILLQL